MTRKAIIEAYKQLKRKQNAVLARHLQLRPDLRGYEMAEFKATWKEYCNLREELYALKLQYKRKNWWQF